MGGGKKRGAAQKKRPTPAHQHTPELFDRATNSSTENHGGGSCCNKTPEEEEAAHFRSVLKAFLYYQRFKK